MSDNTQEDANPQFSKEEIEEAQNELGNMTPEDLLALREQADRAQANTVLPEAVAVCFTEVFTSRGNKVSITCRGVSGRHAIDELANTLRYAREKYGMLPPNQPTNLIQHPPQPPDANEPVYVEESGGSDTTNVTYTPSVTTNAPTYSNTGQPLIDIVVTTITRERKRDGKGDFLRVRGGMYTKFGVPAYDNTWPQGFDINKMQYGVEVTQIPPQMRNARVDTRTPGTKVVQFLG